MMAIPVFPDTKVALKGRKGLVVGIANDVRAPGQMEAVFARIEKDWGRLDFVVHSIAFSPREALQGRVVDVEREGFLIITSLRAPVALG